MRDGNYYALEVTKRLGLEDSGGMVREGPVPQTGALQHAGGDQEVRGGAGENFWQRGLTVCISRSGAGRDNAALTEPARTQCTPILTQRVPPVGYPVLGGPFDSNYDVLMKLFVSIDRRDIVAQTQVIL